MSSTAQESARRIGICLYDPELFWWRSDDDEPCPVCSVDDDDYIERHRFYRAEAENQRLREALERVANESMVEQASDGRPVIRPEKLREIARAALDGTPSAAGER